MNRIDINLSILCCFARVSKFLFLLVFLTLIFFSGYSQEKQVAPPVAPTKKSMEIDRNNHECIYRNKFSLEQRLQFFPFNQAFQIKLVSFDDRPDSTGLFNHGANSLPMSQRVVDYSKLDEVKRISKNQIANLTDILFNNGYKGPISVISQSCYNPRNAILFINAQGETFAFIELCFECGGYRLSSNEVHTGEFCNQKFELLRKFFAKAGIEIGVKQSQNK